MPYISKQPSTAMPPKSSPIDSFKHENCLLKCNISRDMKKICSMNKYPKYNNNIENTTHMTKQETCPVYFRWMYEDLRPWNRTGISVDMVEQAKSYAHFRLIILDGMHFSTQNHPIVIFTIELDLLSEK